MRAIIDKGYSPKRDPQWVNVYQGNRYGASYGILNPTRERAAELDASNDVSQLVYRIRVAWKPGRAPNGEA